MLSIKFRLSDEVRRVSVKPSISYAELVELVHSLSEVAGFDLKYSDEDGDLITIKSDLDLSEAISQLNGRCLVLRVVENTSSGASSAQTTQNQTTQNTPSQPSASEGPNFQKMADDVRITVEEALRQLRGVAPTSARVPEPAPAATPEPASALPDMAKLLSDGLKFLTTEAPNSGLEGFSRKIESALLLARVMSFLNYAKEQVRSVDTECLSDIVSRIEDVVDVDAVTELIRQETKTNPGLEKLVTRVCEYLDIEVEEDTGAVHNVLCDHCDRTIIGVRYKCSVCADYDLCAACERRKVHDAHAFVKIENRFVNWKVAAVPHSAVFVSDVTVPDGMEVQEGAESFVKTWEVRNDGDSAWQEGCYLELFQSIVPDHSGFRFPERVDVQSVLAGCRANVSVTVPSPSQEGRYIARYRLHRGDGEAFGEQVWVDFSVVSKHREGVRMLASLGFTDRDACIAALEASDGDVGAAVGHLVGDQ